MGIACSYGEGEGERLRPDIPKRAGTYEIQAWTRSSHCSLTLRASGEIQDYLEVKLKPWVKDLTAAGWYKAAQEIEVRPAVESDWRAPGRSDAGSDFGWDFYPNNVNVHTVLVEASGPCTEWVLVFDEPTEALPDDAVAVEPGLDGYEVEPTEEIVLTGIGRQFRRVTFEEANYLMSVEYEGPILAGRTTPERDITITMRTQLSQRCYLLQWWDGRSGVVGFSAEVAEARGFINACPHGEPLLLEIGPRVEDDANPWRVVFARY